jgi:hypothetical protein
MEVLSRYDGEAMPRALNAAKKYRFGIIKMA